MRFERLLSANNSELWSLTASSSNWTEYSKWGSRFGKMSKHTSVSRNTSGKLPFICFLMNSLSCLVCVFYEALSFSNNSPAAFWDAVWMVFAFPCWNVYSNIRDTDFPCRLANLLAYVTTSSSTVSVSFFFITNLFNTYEYKNSCYDLVLKIFYSCK